MSYYLGMPARKLHTADIVWEAITTAGGDREKACEALGVSKRTLARYIAEYDLFKMLDAMGFLRHKGAPRGPHQGITVRERVTRDFVAKWGEAVDLGKLAVLLYGADTSQGRNNARHALDDLKHKGVISTDGKRWFVVDTTSPS